MEALALLNLVLIGVLAWKAMAIKDHIEGLESQRKYLETKIDKISKDLDSIIKGVQPVEIPARLPEETLKEVIPGLFNVEQRVKTELKSRERNIEDELVDLMVKRELEKKEVEYVGTENGGPAGLTRDQAQEILANLSKRRKSKLK